MSGGLEDVTKYILAFLLCIGSNTSRQRKLEMGFKVVPSDVKDVFDIGDCYHYGHHYSIAM